MVLGTVWRVLAAGMAACGTACSLSISLDGFSAEGGAGTGVPVDPDPCHASTGTAPTSCTGVDLNSSAAHCGRCGHDCLGAACIDGLCVPETVLTEPVGIDVSAVRGGLVYYDDQIAIIEAPIDGGPRRAVINLDSWMARVDETSVHISTQNGVYAAPLAGGPVVTIAQFALQAPYSVDVDDEHVYWAPPDEVWVAGRDGSGRVLVAGSQGPIHGLAVDDERAYWLAGFDPVVLRSRTHDGSEVLESPPLGSAEQLALHRDHVYWIDLGGSAIRRAPRSDVRGPIETIVASGGSYATVRGLAIDDAHVVWMVDDVLLRASRCGGGTALTLAAGPLTWGIGLDARYAYVGLGQGSLVRIAK